MSESGAPAWLDDARWYYSLIEDDRTQPVSVFDATDLDIVSADSPGMLVLRLVPRFRYSPRVRILDAGGREQGLIRPEGIVPGVCYAMHRRDEPVWTLSVRSFVRKRHSLVPARGDSWTLFTPFFWWQNVSGTARGAPRLVGGVVQVKWVWELWIEPGWESFDLLAAMAFLHRQWFHM